MINLNKAKALLLVLILSGLTVQTTQPVDWSWLTNNSIYRQGNELCARLSKTDAYQQCAPYGSWLFEKAKEHKTTIAACMVCGFIAKKCFDIYKHREYINKKNNEIKKLLSEPSPNIDYNFVIILQKIRCGGDVNTQNDAGMTPLYLAVILECSAGVEELVRYQADPDIQIKDGISARQAADKVQNIEARARIIDIFNGNTNQFNELKKNRKLFEEEVKIISKKIKESGNVSDGDWTIIKDLIKEKKVDVNYHVHTDELGYSAPLINLTSKIVINEKVISEDEMMLAEDAPITTWLYENGAVPVSSI